MRTLLCFLIASPALAAEKLVLVAGGEGSGLKEPFGLDFLPDGSIVVAEYGTHQIMRIDKAGKVSVLAGSGEKGLVDGPAEKARFNAPHNVAVAKDGTVYVADTLNHVVRRIDPKTRAVSTIAGTGKKGFSGDGGPAKEAAFNETYHVVLDREQKHLYVADLGNKRVRQIDVATGIVDRFAGHGNPGIPVDGSTAKEAPLVDPRACAIDSKGRLYILERGGNALRVVEDGKIRTVAGTGKPGAEGDGGRALRATFKGPKFIWVDKNDDVLIADADNSLIRKYLPRESAIVRIAGTGKKGSTGLDGPPTQAQLANAHGIAEAPDGTIYIADSLNGRILKIVK